MRRAPGTRPGDGTGARTLPRHWAMAAALLAGLMILGPSINRAGDKILGRIAPGIVANPD